MQLSEYIDRVQVGLQTFDDYGLSAQMEIAAELRPGAQATLKAKVEFVDDSSLHIRAFLFGQDSCTLVSYAYQYQKPSGALIFRYDNAKHRPDLGFECHKHQLDGSIVAAAPPEIGALVDEVIDYITR